MSTCCLLHARVGGLVSAHCDDPDPIMFSHLKLGLGAA